jgi:hypothetical protein
MAFGAHVKRGTARSPTLAETPDFDKLSQKPGKNLNLRLNLSPIKP